MRLHLLFKFVPEDFQTTKLCSNYDEPNFKRSIFRLKLLIQHKVDRILFVKDFVLCYG